MFLEENLIPNLMFLASGILLVVAGCLIRARSKALKEHEQINKASTAATNTLKK